MMEVAATRGACAQVLHNATLSSSERCEQARRLALHYILKIQSACGHVAELIDYLSLVGCSPSWLPIGVMAILLIVVLSYELLMLATTADRYFVPYLEVIADKLNMSPTLAGCTLLALGNGAPDVFTAFAALNDQSDVNMLVGGVLGASVFTSTVTLAAVIWFQHGRAKDASQRIVPHYFLRDLCTYSVGLAIAASFMRSKGEVSLAESMTLILVYVVYLVLVVMSNYFKVTLDYIPRHESTYGLLHSDDQAFSMVDTVASMLPMRYSQHGIDLGSAMAFDAIGVEEQPPPSPVAMTERFRRAWDTTKTKALKMVPTRIGLKRKSIPGTSSLGDYMQHSDEFDGDISDAHNPVAHTNGGGPGTYAVVAGDEDEGDPVDGDIGGASRKADLAERDVGGDLGCESSEVLLETMENGGESDVRRSTGAMPKQDPPQSFPARFLWVLWGGETDEIPPTGTRAYKLFMATFYLELPFTLARGLSSPPAHIHMDGAVRLRTVLFPFGMAAVALLAFAGPRSFTSTAGAIPVLAIVMGAAAAVSIFMAFMTRHNRQPQGGFELLLAALGFVSSIGTISIISKEVVSLLTSLALMLGISTSILSLTLLATGNSVGDAMANTSLGRKGKFAMAVAAIFGGPIFHDLAGTATAFAGACIKHHAGGGRWAVPVEVEGQTRLVFMFLITSVISSLLVFCVSNFRPHWWFSVYLVLLYAAFVVMCVLEELDVIHV